MDVRRASIDDVVLLGRIAAEGFVDDPVMSWALPHDATRLAKLTVVFGGLARDVLPDRGVVHLADAASAAFWRDPAFEHAGPEEDGTDAEREPDPSEPGPFTEDELRRFAELDRVMHAAHPREPHWYLNVLSTLPSHRNQGLGAAVVRPVLDEADAAGLPCYLESTNPRNRPLYRRLGFEDGDELHLDGGPSLLQMWRDPR